MKNKLPFDELNSLNEKILLSRYKTDNGADALLIDADDIIDEMLDLYLLTISNAVREANNALDGDYEMSADEVDEVLYQSVAGENFIDRVRLYAAVGDAESIKRVAETDAHRIYAEASYMAAIADGAKYKTWHTMEDDRVRDTHWVLQGVKLPIDDYFGSNGDAAYQPGGFETAAENVNCRCWLSYSKD